MQIYGFLGKQKRNCFKNYDLFSSFFGFFLNQISPETIIKQNNQRTDPIIPTTYPSNFSFVLDLLIRIIKVTSKTIVTIKYNIKTPVKLMSKTLLFLIIQKKHETH